jgi:hypothetical protein
VAAGFGIIATVFGGWNTFRTWALESQIKAAEENRRQAEFELKFRRDIYDEVKALLKERDTITLQRTLLVLTLVSSLPKDREDQRHFHQSVEELVRAMMPKDNSPEAAEVRRLIRDRTQEAPLPAAQASAKAAPPPEFFRPVQSFIVSEKGWDIDVFYCTGVQSEADHLALAQKAFEHLKTTADVGRLRLRKLPLDVNGLPEYGGRGLMIRADNDDAERARAQRLAAELEKAGLKGFRVEPNTRRSVWYLSAFVCPS